MNTLNIIAPRLAAATELAQNVAGIMSDYPGINADEPVTIAALAFNAHGWFETRTRQSSGEAFAKMQDNRPQWVHDLTMNAHGEFMPEDWRYDAIRSALSDIADSDAADRDDCDDLAHEFADANVDVYNAARYAWLASNLNRAGYCDEAVSDGLGDENADIIERIGVGQYAESLEVFGLVLDALAETQETIIDELEAIDYVPAYVVAANTDELEG